MSEIVRMEAVFSWSSWWLRMVFQPPNSASAIIPASASIDGNPESTACLSKRLCG